MLGKIILLIIFLGLGGVSRVARSDDLVPLQPSAVPNLEAPKIAARQQAKGGVADIAEYAANLVLARAFNALYREKSAHLVAHGKAKIENGAELVVLVTEIYTSPLTRSVEIGPMTLVEGESVIAALKAYAKDQNTPRLIKDRSGMTKSFLIKVLTKANIAAGFLDEAFPDQMMAVAIQQFSMEEKAQVSREVAQQAAKAVTASKARDVKNELTRDHEGPRQDGRIGGPTGGNTREAEGPTKGTEAKGGAKGDGKGESKGEAKGEVGGQEIRQPN